jgi:hypothetical protein
MAQRLHPIVEHTSDDHTLAPVIEVFPDIVKNMRGGSSTARGEFDMERAYAAR